MSANTFALADVLLSGAIQFLLQRQKVDALITRARLEGREVSPEELAIIKAERDATVSEVNVLLDKVAASGE